MTSYSTTLSPSTRLQSRDAATRSVAPRRMSTPRTAKERREGVPARSMRPIDRTRTLRPQDKVRRPRPAIRVQSPGTNPAPRRMRQAPSARRNAGPVFSLRAAPDRLRQSMEACLIMAATAALAPAVSTALFVFICGG